MTRLVVSLFFLLTVSLLGCSAETRAGLNRFGYYYGRPDRVAYDRAYAQCIDEGYSTLECRREAREVAESYER